MSKPMDLAEAQIALDRDRENVETTARKLYTYCAALRERIRGTYGTMAEADKWEAMLQQAQKCAGLIPILSDFIEYMQNEEAWVSLQHPPSEAHRMSWQKIPDGHEGPDGPVADSDEGYKLLRSDEPDAFPPLGDVVGELSEMNDLIQKGEKNA